MCLCNEAIFINSLSICIDRAINEPVDLVLFGGDAFPDSTPAPYIQSAFASQFRRLAQAQIPTILLVGNHDQYSQGTGGASLSIYDTLAVPHFIVGETITTHLISTISGEIQVITLPWVTPATLLTRPETEGLSLEQINKLLIQKVEPALEGEIRTLNPDVPLSMLVRPEYDYVALGHVHKHQNLNPKNNPPIVYPGSIERVDFSEEKEEKGYVLIEIDRSKQVQWQFCPLPTRPFITINVDLSNSELPEADLLKAIEKKPITDAVVRIIYRLRSEQLEYISIAKINEALSSAHSYTLKADLVSQLARPRLPELGIGKSLDPLEALSTYLENKEDLQDLIPDMLIAAENLLSTIH